MDNDIIIREEDIPAVIRLHQKKVAVGNARFSVCYETQSNTVRMVKVSLDYNKYGKDEGLVMLPYNKGAVGFALENPCGIALGTIVRALTKKVSICDDMQGYDIDAHPITSYVKDGETKYIIWADVIKTKDNSIIYTDCYDGKGDTVDPTSLTKPSLCRATFVFQLSHSIKNGKDIHRMRASLSELYVLGPVNTVSRRTLLDK